MNLIKKLFNRPFKCYLDIIYLRILKFFYKFDSWHTVSSYSCRKYKKQLIEIINNIENENIVTVEIGCGLGDIISRVDSENRFGFDFDNRVINASRILHKNTTFLCGSFEDVLLLNTKIDLLILVNWIHNISMKELENSIELINSTSSIQYIVVDEVLESIKGYKYHHNFSKLKNYETYSLTPDIENIRNYRALKRIG
jgi:hypothetical protein